jgi:hypothetical protein
MENGKKPAFQTTIGMSNSEMENMGLTKLEYFAGLAMQGVLAEGVTSVSMVVPSAIGYAKSLLAELEKLKSE